MSAVAGIRHEHGDDGYFEHTRPELRALVPASAHGASSTSAAAAVAWARPSRPSAAASVVGLEAFPEAAAHARARLDDVLELDLDALAALPPATRQLRRDDLRRRARAPARPAARARARCCRRSPTEGTLVFSIPNVRHWSVVCPLLVNDSVGVRRRGPARPHARPLLHARASSCSLLGELGLEAVHVGVNDHLPLPDQLHPLVDLAVAYGADRDEAALGLGAYQYLIVARRKARDEARPFVSLAFLDELLGRARDAAGVRPRVRRAPGRDARGARAGRGSRRARARVRAGRRGAGPATCPAAPRSSC